MWRDVEIRQGFQSNATAWVQGLKHHNLEERRRRLGLMTLEDRRERGDLIEVKDLEGSNQN